MDDRTLWSSTSNIHLLHNSAQPHSFHGSPDCDHCPQLSQSPLDPLSAGRAGRTNAPNLLRDPKRNHVPHLHRNIHWLPFYSDSALHSGYVLGDVVYLLPTGAYFIAKIARFINYWDQFMYSCLLNCNFSVVNIMHSAQFPGAIGMFLELESHLTQNSSRFRFSRRAIVFPGFPRSWHVLRNMVYL